MKNIIPIVLITAMHPIKPAVVQTEDVYINQDSYSVVYDDYYRWEKIHYLKENDDLNIEGYMYSQMWAENRQNNNQISSDQTIYYESIQIYSIQHKNNVILNDGEIKNYFNLNTSNDRVFTISQDIYTSTNDSWQQWMNLPIPIGNAFWQNRLNIQDYLYTQILGTNSYQGYDIDETDADEWQINLNTTKYIIIYSQYQPLLQSHYELLTISGNQFLNNNLYITYNKDASQQVIVNQEVINLPELIFTILSMPLSFISQAFNFTLFPNTPYAINISNLFLGIATALIIILLVKIIVRFIK